MLPLGQNSQKLMFKFTEKTVKKNSTSGVFPLFSRCVKMDRIWWKIIRFLNLQVRIALNFMDFCEKYGILHARQRSDKTNNNNSCKKDASRRLHDTKHFVVWCQNGCFCEESYLKWDSIVSYKGRATKCYVFLDD